jgi:hypothetical protein
LEEHREGDDYIEERIDRAVANSSWLTSFTWHSVEVLVAITSYHNPILLKFNEDAPVTCPSRTGRYGKKFEASWTFDPEWKQVMSDSWVGNFAARSPLSRVHKKLLACQHDLSTWSWHKFGNDQLRLHQKNKELILMQSRVPLAPSSLIKILQSELMRSLLVRISVGIKGRSKIGIVLVIVILNTSIHGLSKGRRSILFRLLRIEMGEYGRKKVKLVRLSCLIMKTFLLLKGLWGWNITC